MVREVGRFQNKEMANKTSRKKSKMFVDSVRVSKAVRGWVVPSGPEISLKERVSRGKKLPSDKKATVAFEHTFKALKRT